MKKLLFFALLALVGNAFAEQVIIEKVDGGILTHTPIDQERRFLECNSTCVLQLNDTIQTVYEPVNYTAIELISNQTIDLCKQLVNQTNNTCLTKDVLMNSSTGQLVGLKSALFDNNEELKAWMTDRITSDIVTRIDTLKESNDATEQVIKELQYVNITQTAQMAAKDDKIAQLQDQLDTANSQRDDANFLTFLMIMLMLILNGLPYLIGGFGLVRSWKNAGKGGQ